LHFNVSQSHDLAFFAFATEALLGVDIEKVRPLSDAEPIVRQFFSPNECNDFLRLDPDDRVEGFYSCWTRKEAYVKAIGEGLYAPLDQFQVTLNPRHPAAFVSINGCLDRASEWSLFHIRPADTYVGAVAVYGRGWTVREWHHNDTRDCLAFIRERATAP
jgi:4'-phosphopantetheinyl transferase